MPHDTEMADWLNALGGYAHDRLTTREATSIILQRHGNTEKARELVAQWVAIRTRQREGMLPLHTDEED